MMLHLFHKWTRWEEYKQSDYHPDILQFRDCEVCNKRQIDIIFSNGFEY